MFESTDTRNHIMAIELVHNLDPNFNTVYILTLYYKYSHPIIKEEWESILNNLSEANQFNYKEELFCDAKNDSQKFSSLFNYIEENYPEYVPLALETWKQKVRPFLQKFGLGLFVEILDKLELKTDNKALCQY